LFKGYRPDPWVAGIGCTCRVTQMGLSGRELVVVYLLATANIS
jgi:hypothetical protein